QHAENKPSHFIASCRKTSAVKFMPQLAGGQQLFHVSGIPGFSIKILLDVKLPRLHNYSYEGISMQMAEIVPAAGFRSTKKLLIGNLPERGGKAAVEMLQSLFSPVGKLLSVSVLNHGFAFVEMTSADADRALIQLRGCRVDGKAMTLDEAHPRRSAR